MQPAAKKLLVLLVHKAEFCHLNVYVLQINLKIVKESVKIVNFHAKHVLETKEIAQVVMKMMVTDVHKVNF